MTSKKLRLRFIAHVLVVRHPPTSTSCLTDVIDVIRVLRPSLFLFYLFFAALSFLCTILNTNWRTKMGEA